MTDKKLGMMVYDGINFFVDGQWTGLEFDSVEEGRHTIGFLQTLTDEQLDHWIRTQTYLRDEKRQQTYNVLKFDRKYSGETTAHHPVEVHKTWEETKGLGDDCIQAQNIFEVQWTNCPVEVEDDVRRLWRNDDRLHNDVCYAKWDEEMADEYPAIAEYLKLRGIKECLIHWWW